MPSEIRSSFGAQSVRLWAAALLALLIAVLPATAQETGTLRGVALVIGNGDYEHLSPLANPKSDARLIEDLLSDLGFDTDRSTDSDRERLLRDIDRFIEDAEDADVAVVYYAGHGVEAAGENWLVPVDADIASLDDASAGLVPLSAILDRLRAAVPVTILLLDACRDNPFPPGATLTARAGDAPAPVSATGLGETRGGRVLGAAPAADNLGMVIGFAAEPGKAALDGTAGDHSPYAAAVARHLAAMAGEEFGTVMRMVAEEVYLQTGGRQRPWVNESLRRLLYFGEAPKPIEGPEGDILEERRQLLVRISTLPDMQRNRAEDLARTGRVPMSVVFAMMQALNVDPGEDPTALEARLRTEIDRFARNRSAREALTNPDPELARLTALADQAELEGALNAANDIREQAKTRVAALRSTREQQIADLRQRIVEDAEVFARSAETKKLLFRHADAARDFGEARAIVADWDADRARSYLVEEIDAWRTEAELRGTAIAVSSAESLARTALAGTLSPTETVRMRHRLALALMVRAPRSNDIAAVREAVSILDLARPDAVLLPDAERARLIVDAGRAGGQLGLADGNVTALQEAEARFREAAELARAAGDQVIEIEARFRFVQAMYYRWTMQQDPALFTQMAAEMASLSEMLDDEPDPLAARYAARAPEIAFDLAMRLNSAEALSLAANMNGDALRMFDRERFPVIWAELAVNAARIALEKAERFGDPSQLRAAIHAHDTAIVILRDAGAATAALDAEWQRALTLTSLALRTMASDDLETARAAIEAVRTAPLAQANTQQLRLVRFQQARVDAALAANAGDAAGIETAIDGLRAALASLDPQRENQLIVFAEAELGKAVYWRALAAETEDEDRLREAASLMGKSVGQYREWKAHETNLIPFLDLYKYYADATASLAVASHRPDELTTAIETNEWLLGRMRDVGFEQGVALTANTLAYVLVHSLRADYDPARLALAKEMLSEALDRVDDFPDYAGYFTNTACELKTEEARQERDRALAEDALALCRSGAEKLVPTGDSKAAAESRASIAAAEALVRDLTP